LRAVAHRGYVPEAGNLVAHGTPDALPANQDIPAACLGGRKTG
jgi:ABC-type branched-subunit amino acid transport system ATPase component